MESFPTMSWTKITDGGERRLRDYPDSRARHACTYLHEAGSNCCCPTEPTILEVIIMRATVAIKQLYDDGLTFA